MRDTADIFHSIDRIEQNAVFLLVGAASTFTSSLNTYIQSWIQLRWRRWMTARYINYWLTGSAHYRMQLTGNETDNPDQRIAEDISQYITYTWTYSFSFVQNCISLVTYAIMLMNIVSPLLDRFVPGQRLYGHPKAQRKEAKGQ